MSAEPIARLTESQRTYLRMVFAHRSSKQIAQQLGISAHTVDKRIKEAMRILGVGSRIEAARLLASAEGGQNHVEVDSRLGAQSLALAETSDSASLAALGDEGHGRVMASAGAAAGEEQRPSRQALRDTRTISLPFPTRDHPTNSLSILQRAGWMIGLIIGLAVATGILLSGLTALSTLLIALSH